MHVAPDVEQLLVDYISDGIAATDFSAAHVGTKIPNPRVDYFVVLYLNGGFNTYPVFFDPNVTIDVWGKVESEAFELASIVDALIVDVDQVDGNQFYKTDTFSLLLNFPDPETGIPRYRSSYGMHVRKRVY